MKSQTTLNDLEDVGIGKKTSDLPGEMIDQTDMAATIEETTEEIGAIEIETGEITGLILEMIDGIETENGIEIGETIEVTECMVEKGIIMTNITQEIKMKKVAATIMIEGQDQDQVTVDSKEELHKNKKKVLFVKLQRKDVP